MVVMKTALLLVVCAGAAMGANILLNPSFEVWMDTIGVNLPVGWLSSELLHPGSAVKDGRAHSGHWCVQLTGTDTSAFISTVTLVRAGNHYEFSGFCQVPGVLAGTFVLQFLSMLGGLVGSPELIPAYYSGGEYRNYSRWLTAPDSAMFLSVSFATLPTALAYVDDVTLDDTSVHAVLEPARAPVARAPVRKVFVLPAEGGRPVANGVRFDALGRRVHGCPRPGIYFLLER
jgi:hypothetical protein